MSRPALHPVRLGLLLGLAHHPLCSSYRTDVVRLGRLHVCSGCLATWPTFAVALPLAAVARLQGASAWALLAAGLALGLPQLASYLTRRSRGERASAKVLGGVGLALALVGLLGLGLPLAGLAAALVAVALLSIGLQAVRMRSMLATCDACPFRRDWDACPGFNALPAPPGAPRDVPASLLVR